MGAARRQRLALGAAQAQDPVADRRVLGRRLHAKPGARLSRALHGENPHVTIINDDGSANALAGLRAQAQAGNVTWDLVDMLPSDAQLACDEGIILQIDHDEMLAPPPDGTPGRPRTSCPAAWATASSRRSSIRRC
jgi:putative spermidine/putrescine transport system substrate-binding protein